MKLTKLIEDLCPACKIKKIINRDIKGIALDSRKVRRDYLFIAIKGVKDDGNKYINDAIDRGATVIVGESAPRFVNPKVIFLRVKDGRSAILSLAKKYFLDPQEKIKLIGITGTNGKTTISYIVEKIFNENGSNCGVIGTINCRYQNKIMPTLNTTPNPIDIYGLLKNMVDKKVNYCAVEVTSHALEQKRISPGDYHYAVFTNIGWDHLDYHKNIEKYFLAKLKLFKNLKRNSFAVINIDDKYAKRIMKSTKARVITYGLKKNASIYAEDIELSLEGLNFTVRAFGESFLVKTNLIGTYNIYNILAGIAVALKEGVNIKVIKKALRNIYVPGRLEKCECRVKDVDIFVDFAHTEDALRNVILALKKIARKRIIVVFGCGGDRDKLKRPKMGKVVTELADYAIITSDNPRTEEPLDIINDITRGVKKNNFHIEINRKLAIIKALSISERGDIVLVAGKGHEKCQIFKDKVIDFDDRKVIKECLKSLN